MDLRAYGKPEEEELLKRKTFYDFVEDLIDEIKEGKEEKALKKLQDKYNHGGKKNNFNEFDRKSKDKDENADTDIVDNAINKHAETSKELEKVKIRRQNEERVRHHITNILVQSDLSKRAIYNSFERLYAKKSKEDMINNNDENKKNKDEKKNDNKEPEKNNEGIILKNEKKENKS